ncbi:putative monooxygenase [Halenospora varia]|nr:putative monooxygenase [Halenospora varia]
MASPESPLHLLIIGGGLCGLSAAISTRLAGHHVTVLESVSAFREVGAGLQITPNGTRLLRAWGLSDVLGPKAAVPTYFRMRRYTGKMLAERTKYSDEIEGRYKSSLWCLHRADLQVIGVDWGEEQIQNEYVGGVSVSLEGGEVVRGDIVLAADGVWSDIRQKLIGMNIQPKPTGDLAYRILLDRESIRDGKLREWLDNPGINIWVGPEKHAVGYSIKGGRWLNLVLLVKDNLPEDVMKDDGDLAEMKAIFQEWDPSLAQFLEHVEKVDKWRLNYLEPLPFWKSASGTFLLAGDCAHPMLPYMAQGANSSLEDGATIGALLSKVQRRDQISAAMTMYDTIRRPRINQLVKETFKQGKEHHLPDGIEQVKRDQLLSKSFETPVNGFQRTGATWTHPKIQPWIYGYDAYAEVEKAYEQQPF